MTLPSLRTDRRQRQAEKARQRFSRHARVKPRLILERLEERVVLSVFDLTGGHAAYLAASGIDNNVTVSLTAGTFSLQDPNDNISLTANAIAAGCSVDSTHHTVTESDAFILIVLINTGNGSDTFYIQSSDDPITITPTNNAGGTDSVFLGVAGSGVQQIKNTVTINNSRGTTSVQADDSTNTSTATNVTVSSSLISGLLAAGTINIGSGALSNGGLTILGGTQTNTFTFTGTPSPSVTLNTGSNAADQTTVKQLSSNAILGITAFGPVTIGSTSNTSNVLGTVNITGDPTSTSVSIDDSLDSTSRTFHVSTATNAGVTTGTTTGISATGKVTYKSINSYSLSSSTGNDTFNIDNTMPDIVNTFNTLSNTKVVNLLATAVGSIVNIDDFGSSISANIGNAGMTSGLLGTLNFTQSGGGNLNLTVDDSNDTNPCTVGITNTAGSPAITGLTSLPITLAASIVSGLLVKGGNGGNAFTISNDGSNAYATTLTSGSGNDSFVITQGSSLNGGTIDGGAGSDTLDYSSYTTFITVNLNASPGIAPGTGSVSNIENVIAGSGGSLFTPQAGTASSLTGGGGNDTFVIPANAGNVTVNGNGGVDDLQLSGAGAGGDSFTMVGNNTPTVTTITGSSPTHTVTSSGINTVELNGDTGNTTATVDFSAGNPIPAGGITYTGGGGASNTLILKNDFATPSFTNETYNATAAGSGNLNFFNSLASLSTINFSGLTPVIDSVSVTNYTLNAPSAINNIAINSASVNSFTGSLIASTDASPTFESAAIANKSNVTLNSVTTTDTAVTVNDPGTSAGLSTLTINTGNGNDFVNLINTPATVTTTVNTGSGTDSLSVNAAGLGGSTTVQGSTANNSLIYDAGKQTTANNVVSTIQGTLTSGIFPTLTYLNFTSVAINNIKDLPLSKTPAALLIQEGELFSDVVGSFGFSNANPVANQVDPVANAGDFTATIDWGDGSPVTAGTIVSNGAGGWNVLGTHTYARVSTPTISVSVTHNSSTSSGTANGITTSSQTNGGSTTTMISAMAVSDAPLTAFGSPIVATEGPAGAVPAGTLLATFTDANPLSNLSDFTATVDWGDGTVVTLPPGSITLLSVPGTYKIVSGAAHTYAEEGLYTVKVNISDVGRSGAIATSTATANDATLTATGTPVSSTDGNSFSGQVATFTDADSAGVIGDYTVSINWGDGVTTPGILTQPGGVGSAFVVSGTHAWPTGSYPITVSISDSGGASSTATATATVSSANLTGGTGAVLNVVEGQPFSAQLGVFTTANPNAVSSQFAAMVSWGDGTTSTGIVTQSSNGSFSVSGNHTYAEESFSLPISITVTDLTGPVATITGSALIVDAPLSSNGVNVSGVEGTAIPAGTLVATFSDADPAGAIGDYAASIDWGDGTFSTGTISGIGGRVSGFLVVSATPHIYAEEGTYSVHVTIDEAGGGSTVAPSTATIGDAALTVTGTGVSATEGNSFTGQVATFTDADPAGASADYTVAINWGDGIITPGIVSQPGGIGTAFIVTGSHTYTFGTFPITVSVKDAGGAQASSSTTANVTGAALTPGNNPALSGIEGVGLTNDVGTFTSANPLAASGDFAVTINWGDGSPVSTGTVHQAADGMLYVSGGHIYTEESGGASFSISVTVLSTSGITATLSASATISDAPLTSSGVNLIGVEGAAIPVGMLVASFSDADPTGTAADYTATIDWGDGTTTAATIVAVGGLGSAFNIVSASPHSYLEEGAYNIRVVINDSGGSSTTASSQAAITDAGLSATGTDLSATEGNSFTGQVATFIDADPAGAAADHIVAINWGDGVITPGIVTQPGGIGTAFVVSGSHTYKFGMYPITVNVNDAGGKTATATATATVAGAALTPGSSASLTGTEGSALSADVGTFTSANPLAGSSDFSASIDWGDGTPLSIGEISEAPDGTFHVAGGHTYAEETATPYAVIVTVMSTSGVTTTLNPTAAIADAPLLATAQAAAATEGVSAVLAVASFIDSDTNGIPSDYSVVINWGDGTTSTGAAVSVASSGGSTVLGSAFTVSASHVYSEQGSFIVTTTITDTGDGTAKTSALATVADAPLTSVGVPVTGKENQPLDNVPVATFTDAGGANAISNYTAMIDWGDGSPATQGVITLGTDGVTFTVSGNHSFTATGVHAVHVVISDEGGARTQAITAATTTAATADGPFVITGKLDPGSDSGVSNSDNITNVVQPLFTGTSKPGTIMKLYATGTLNTAVTLIGEGVTDAAGHWSIPSDNSLADDSYTITATAANPDSPSEVTRPAVLLGPGGTGGNNLVVDTSGPVVSEAIFRRPLGQILVTIQDVGPGGISVAQIQDGSFFSFHPHGNRAPLPRNWITAITVVQMSAGIRGPIEVQLQINNGRPLRTGRYDLTIKSGGVTDIAGNVLDGEYYGYVPSGNDKPGGDFNALFVSSHGYTFAALPTQSTVTPRTPPGKKPVGYATPSNNGVNDAATHVAWYRLNQVNEKSTYVKKPAVKVLAKPAVIISHAVHDAALASVIVPKRKGK